MEGWDTDSNDGDFLPHTNKKAKIGLKMVTSGVSKGSPNVGGEGSSKQPKGKARKTTLKFLEISVDQNSSN